MKLILELDLESKEIKILSQTNITKKDIISLICDYFRIPYKDLIKTPLKRKNSDGQYYVMCRQFITYYLSTKLELAQKEIHSVLNYDEGSTNIISHNLQEINQRLNVEKDVQYTRSFNNLEKLFSLSSFNR
jgi:chromosomal replication initiation ATPase DnaA